MGPYPDEISYVERCQRRAERTNHHYTEESKKQSLLFCSHKVNTMQLNGTFDVKLGKSFLEPSAATYMTIRCDFMPASVDRSKPGSIKVDDGREVVVNLPNVASVGAGSTMFRGSARPVQKECILIYNKRTGELTLERIAHAVQLKKTREERKPSPPVQQSNHSGPSGLAANRSRQIQSTSQSRSGVQVPRDNAPQNPPKSRTIGSPKRKPAEQSTSFRASNSLATKPAAQASKTRTLSSSSSSGSCSSSISSSDSDDGGPNQGVDDRSSTVAAVQNTTQQSADSSDSDDSYSDLNSLNSPSDKEMIDNSGKEAERRNHSFPSAPFSAIQNPAHRKLIEHDLRLSDSDSDSC
ncbi:unnamed protein product [Echinostoma caproni]|uniref:EAF domain-containing protein n=1 Tax=Echinostoma caproni TaxID=27848 RepID=A0A183ADW0_9TREM|nr:unnamed protein product [Echinostoma caproni]